MSSTCARTARRLPIPAVTVLERNGDLVKSLRIYFDVGRSTPESCAQPGLVLSDAAGSTSNGRTRAAALRAPGRR